MRMNLRGSLVFCASLTFGGWAFGDSIAVVPYGEETVSVASGTVVQDAPVRLQKDAVVYKTGAGDWSVPAGSVSGDSGTIAVRQGSLTLTSGGTSTYAKPTSVLNRAALWLDATSANVITTNGTDGTAYVTEWRDVRETKSVAPYDRLRALPRYTASVEAWATNAPPVVRQDENGNDVIYFGRYRSGRWMALADKTAADGSAPFDLRGIRHAFIVYRAVQNYWFLMSESANSGKQCWHPVSSQAPLNGSYCAANYEDDFTLSTKLHYLDGVLIDPSETKVSSGMRLLEHKYTVTSGYADSLANCSSLTGTSANSCRQGGDDYCEIVIFTEELTEVERVAVEDYLMAKWSLTKAADSVCVETAVGTSVIVSDVTVPAIVGAGTLIKTGSGKTVLLAAGDEAPASLPLTIDAGSVTVRDEVPVQATAGKTIAASQQFDGTETTLADGVPGVVAKTGAGRLRLESVPVGATKLSVGAGELTLTVANRQSGLVAAPSAEGSMTAPGFEGVSAGAHWGYETETTLEGWTFARDAGETADYYAGIYNGTLWSTLTAHSGSCFGQIRGLAYLHTDVTIPEDGFYELSFQFAQRNANRSTVDVQFGKPDSLRTVARVFNTFASTYRPVTVSLPYAKKGTYRLCFHGINANTQSSGVIDDIKIVRLAREEAVVKIPNGDFEVTASRGYATIVESSSPLASDAPAGWTITPQADSKCTAAIIGATNESGRTYSLACGRPGGRAQLILASSTPTISTSFAPEAFGRFRVRADLGRYNSHVFLGFSAYSAPEVHVCVNVKGVETDLGALATVGGDVGPMMKQAVCPTAFEIPADATSVSISLHNAQNDSIAFIDNIELIRVDDASAELVRDGGFEKDASPDWTFVKGPKYTNGQYGDFASRLDYGAEASTMGRAKYAGVARLRLWNACWAYQQVTFAEAGDYQLRFHAAMRMDERYEPGRKGYEPFCAYLAADGVTNVIGKAISTTTNYIAHCWRFRIEAPGTYDLGFAGQRRPDEAEKSDADRTAFIDGVSVRKLSADESAAPEIPQDLAVEVAADARLRLDFSGTNRVGSVRIGGRRASGVIDAARFPDSVFGTGALYVEPKGLVLIYR